MATHPLACTQGNLDDVKRIFTESNPYYLGVTMAVSILHTVFDVLAFRSDIGFWSQNKSMEGLSARTVVINAFMQVRLACMSCAFCIRRAACRRRACLRAPCSSFEAGLLGCEPLSCAVAAAHRGTR